PRAQPGCRDGRGDRPRARDRRDRGARARVDRAAQRRRAPAVGLRDRPAALGDHRGGRDRPGRARPTRRPTRRTHPSRPARAPPGRLNAARPPPWGYEIALLRSGTTEVVATAPAELSRRVDNLGARRFENLRARLPLTAAPEGNYRVIVLATARNRFVVPQRLARARPGAIAPARTVLLPAGEGHPATRYLVHTRGRDGHTWLTVQHGDAARDVRRWRRTLLRKDLSLLVRDRNVGMRMRLARLVRLVTRPFFARREIWLVAERADTAQ